MKTQYTQIVKGSPLSPIVCMSRFAAVANENALRCEVRVYVYGGARPNTHIHKPAQPALSTAMHKKTHPKTMLIHCESGF